MYLVVTNSKCHVINMACGARPVPQDLMLSSWKLASAASQVLGLAAETLC